MRLPRFFCRSCSAVSCETTPARLWREPVRWLRELPLCVKVFALVYVALLLSGCASLAPAQVPAQLDATPGPPVVITENAYRSTAFTVWYPPDWRAVSAATFADPWAVFVSPADDALMAVAVDPADLAGLALPTAMDGERRETATLTPPDAGPTLHTVLLATPDAYATALPLYRRFLASVMLPASP